VQAEEGAEEERLVTCEDACDVLGEHEAPLRVPAGFEIVTCGIPNCVLVARV